MKMFNPDIYGDMLTSASDEYRRDPLALPKRLRMETIAELKRPKPNYSKEQIRDRLESVCDRRVIIIKRITAQLVQAEAEYI